MKNRFLIFYVFILMVTFTVSCRKDKIGKSTTNSNNSSAVNNSGDGTDNTSGSAADNKHTTAPSNSDNNQITQISGTRNWIGVDDLGSIYSLDANLNSLGMVGSVPSGMNGQWAAITSNGSSQYLLQIGDTQREYIFVSSDMNSWTLWDQNIVSEYTWAPIYNDGSKWWFSTFMDSKVLVYYRAPTDSQWTLAQGIPVLSSFASGATLKFKDQWLYSARSTYDDPNNPIGVIYRSSDGISFTNTAVLPQDKPSDFSYYGATMVTNGSVVVLFARDIIILEPSWGDGYGFTDGTYTSSDAISWTFNSFAETLSIMPYSLISDGSKFYLGGTGASGKLLYSSDGKNWTGGGITGLSSQVDSTIIQINYFNHKYVVKEFSGQANGGIKKSSDGLAFTALVHPVSGRVFNWVYPDTLLLNY